MRVVIAGSRSIKDYFIIEKAIEASGFDVTFVISGGAIGVDSLAIDWAKANNIEYDEKFADWDDLSHPDAVIKYNGWGKPYDAVAGHRRNKLMAELGEALILVWDGKSTGSVDMRKHAKRKGIPIFEYQVDTGKIREARLEKSRLEVLRWLEEMYDLDAIAMDTESSGGTTIDEIIDLGACSIKSGKVLFDKLLKPMEGVKFNYYATMVHKITKAQLTNAPNLPEVWDEWLNISRNRPIIAWNHSSDKRMLTQTVKKYDLILPEFNWHCSMRAYGRYTMRSKAVKLSTACKEMNAKAGTHRAISDALASARVLYRMSKGFVPEIDVS